jgi:hypothetical protein
VQVSAFCSTRIAVCWPVTDTEATSRPASADPTSNATTPTIASHSLNPVGVSNPSALKNTLTACAPGSAGRSVATTGPLLCSVG